MSPPGHSTFALERFAWDAPDRLEVSGWFSALPEDARPSAPVLVVRGADGTHRLPAASIGAAGPTDEGRHWEAAFVWQEPPAPFDVAELELGAGIVVELPQPGPETRALGEQLLAVSRTETGGGAGQLRLEAELVSTQEELREVRSALEQTQEQLARAREDLGADHARHAADVERFRDGLARVRESAERALASEAATAQRAQDELAVLRERLAQHERAGEEVEELRSELETARRQSDEAHARLRDAQRPAAEAHAEAEQLLRRVAAVANALDGRA